MLDELLFENRLVILARDLLSQRLRQLAFGPSLPGAGFAVEGHRTPVVWRCSLEPINDARVRRHSRSTLPREVSFVVFEIASDHGMTIILTVKEVVDFSGMFRTKWPIES